MLFEFIAVSRAIRKQKKAIKYTQSLIDMYNDRDMLADMKPLEHVLNDQTLVLIYLKLEKECILNGKRNL